MTVIIILFSIAMGQYRYQKYRLVTEAVSLTEIWVDLQITDWTPYVLTIRLFYSCEDLKVISLAIHYSKIDLLQSKNYPNCEATSLCTSFLRFNSIAGIFNIQKLFFSSKRLLTYFCFQSQQDNIVMCIISKI